jgi:chromosome segregation ATPase
MNQLQDSFEEQGKDIPEPGFIDRFSLIFSTGFSEIKRKGVITRLFFEIKGLEKDKEKYVHALGNHAWEAHVEHFDFAGIVVNLKELQIDINRYETQYGEHDTQIKDIESAKSELTERFNVRLDQLEQEIMPHRQKIETINAEKEDNKIQIEELRSKQDHLSQQVRNHQKSIQEFDLDQKADRTADIELEKGAIRNIFHEKCEIECKIPFLMSNIEKLKLALADETSEISRLESEKEIAKREYEQRMRDYNHQIHQLEEKKKQTARQKEQLKREMEPFLFDLGKKMEQLRLQESSFPEVYEQLDVMNAEIEARRQQIIEAESLSRAMDQAAWTKFLVFSGSLVLLIVSLVFILL